MLPKRIPRQPKRSNRWRSTAHCNFVRSHECCVPGCNQRPIEVAHIRCGTDGGMSQKPSDYHTISLCRFHHAEQHRIGERTFAGCYEIDPWALANEFAAKSPKAREIREHKNAQP